MATMIIFCTGYQVQAPIPPDHFAPGIFQLAMSHFLQLPWRLSVGKIHMLTAYHPQNWSRCQKLA
jgi:hypothetical protein